MRFPSPLSAFPNAPASALPPPPTSPPPGGAKSSPSAATPRSASRCSAASPAAAFPSSLSATRPKASRPTAATRPAWMFDRSEECPAAGRAARSGSPELQVGSLPVAESCTRRHDRAPPPRADFTSSPHGPNALKRRLTRPACTRCASSSASPSPASTAARPPRGRVREPLRFPLVLRTARQNDATAAGHAPWKAGYALTRPSSTRLAPSFDGFADSIIVQEYHPGVEDTSTSSCTRANRS